jgi:hypothetical protein
MRAYGDYILQRNTVLPPVLFDFWTSYPQCLGRLGLYAGMTSKTTANITQLSIRDGKSRSHRTEYLLVHKSLF